MVTLGAETAMRSLVLVEAPTNLGLRAPAQGREPGVRYMAESMRARNLSERLRAKRVERLMPPPYSPEADWETGYLNGQSLRAFASAQAKRLRSVLARGDFPVVVGGDCSLLLGDLLALKGLGRYGLVFIDGHDDYSPPRDPAKYAGRFAAAGRDLALATGADPSPLADIDGAGPYVAEDDVVVFGAYRDPDDAADFDMDLIDSRPIFQMGIERLRECGARAAAELARSFLEGRGLDGYWIHVDVDVLDRSVMPSVDSPNPKGLRFEELVAALRVFLGSPLASGIELCIYDPELDPEGLFGDQLADVIVASFSGMKWRAAVW